MNSAFETRSAFEGAPNHLNPQPPSCERPRHVAGLPMVAPLTMRSRRAEWAILESSRAREYLRNESVTARQAVTLARGHVLLISNFR
jgi:hypothetical protein